MSMITGYTIGTPEDVLTLTGESMLRFMFLIRDYFQIKDGDEFPSVVRVDERFMELAERHLIACNSPFCARCYRISMFLQQVREKCMNRKIWFWEGFAAQEIDARRIFKIAKLINQDQSLENAKFLVMEGFVEV